MHLYWRVIEELKFLGETRTIRDPDLLRCFRLWLRKKADAIALSLTDNSPGHSPVFKYIRVLLSLSINAHPALRRP